MDKRDSGLVCRLVVAVGIADIDRVLQMVLFDDCTDVVCLCLSGIARTEMAFEIVTEACGFLEKLRYSPPGSCLRYKAGNVWKE